MDAESVAKLNGQTFNGSVLSVEIAHARGDKGNKKNEGKSPAASHFGNDRGFFSNILVAQIYIELSLCCEIWLVWFCLPVIHRLGG